jgi:hypothetical protein
MSNFVSFGLRQISLAERSHSSFALIVISCVHVRNFFLFPVMPMRGVSGRSKLMKVGLRIGIRRLSADGGHSLLGQRECTDRERNRFCKL